MKDKVPYLPFVQPYCAKKLNKNEIKFNFASVLHNSLWRNYLSNTNTLLVIALVILKFSSTNILRNCLAIILLKFSYCICINVYLTRSLFNNKPWWYSSYIMYARFFMFNNLWHNWFQKENHTNQLNPASNIKSCGLQNGSSLLPQRFLKAWREWIQIIVKVLLLLL